MNELHFWTLIATVYQTLVSVTVGWWVLGCNLRPHKHEIREWTLVKLMYLYEPHACGRVYFYNCTGVERLNATEDTLAWPPDNAVASSFRSKVSMWMTLHVVWALLFLVIVSQNQRPCTFYAATVPFTLAGAVLLVMDVANAAMFVVDALNTATEADILNYITPPNPKLGKFVQLDDAAETSWIGLLMAYLSCRGIVQWFINFWIVKDNYFDGLANYRRIQMDTPKGKGHQNKM